MNKHEANKLSMFDAVISFMDLNSGKSDAIPIISETVAQLKTEVTELKAMELEFIGNTKPETIDKHLKEEKLLSVIVKIASTLFVLGVRTNNSELIVNNKVSKSGLDYLRPPLLIKKATEILTTANKQKESLLNYGITETILAEALDAICAFQAAIDKQTDVHASGVAEREALSNKFSVVSDLLYDQLDPMMELFEDTEPLFYDGFQNVRVIKDLGVRKREPVGDVEPVVK